jgi:hypothetical protein
MSRPRPLPALPWHKGTGKVFRKLAGKAVYFPKSWTQERCEQERLRLLAEWKAAGRLRAAPGAD